MSDRELLEMAAKAAGLPLGYGEGEYFYCAHGPFGASMYGKQGNAPLNWNPLDDDGDALRLAVKLHIDFKAFDATVRTWVGDPVAQRVIASIEELCETDPYAATRRAIVRAAAELGKAKP